MPPYPYSDNSQGPNCLNFEGRNDTLILQRSAANSQQQETAVKTKGVHLTKQMKFCSEVLAELIAEDDKMFSSRFFTSKNLGIRQAAIYEEVIKHPMDLPTVKNKLANGQYKTADEFAADMRLMFSNCYKCYAQGFCLPPALACSNSMMVQMARKLQHDFEMKFAKMPDAFPESVDDCEESEKESRQRLSAQHSQQQVPKQTIAPADHATMAAILRVASPSLFEDITTKLQSCNLDAFELKIDEFPESDNVCEEREKESVQRLSVQQSQQQVPQQTEAPALQASMTQRAASPYLFRNITKKSGSCNLDDKMPGETNMLDLTFKSSSGAGDNREGKEERLKEAQQTQQQVPIQFQASTHETEKTESEIEMRAKAYVRKLKELGIYSLDYKILREIFTSSESSKSSSSTGDRTGDNETQNHSKIPPDSVTCRMSPKSGRESREQTEAQFRARLNLQKFPRPYVPQGTERNADEVPRQFQSPVHKADMTKNGNSEDQREFQESYQKYLEKFLKETEALTHQASSKSSSGIGNNKEARQWKAEQTRQQVQAPSRPIDMTRSANAEQPNPYEFPLRLVYEPRVPPYMKPFSSIINYDRPLSSTINPRLPRFTEPLLHHMQNVSTTEGFRYNPDPMLPPKAPNANLFDWRCPSSDYENASRSKSPPSRLTEPLLHPSRLTEPLLNHSRLTEPLLHHMLNDSTREGFRYNPDPMLPPKAPNANLFDWRCPSSDYENASRSRPYPAVPFDDPSHETIDSSLFKLINSIPDALPRPKSRYSNFLNPDPRLSSATRPKPFAGSSMELIDIASTIFHGSVVRKVMDNALLKTGRFPETLEDLCEEILVYKGIKQRPAAVPYYYGISTM